MLAVVMWHPFLFSYSLRELQQRANERAQRVKGLVAKPGDLNLIPGFHIMEEEKELLQVGL